MCHCALCAESKARSPMRAPGTLVCLCVFAKHIKHEHHPLVFT